MPKSVRRIVVERTVTYQTIYDVNGYPEGLEADMLNLLGGPQGLGGQLAMGELLAQAGASRGGVITKTDWKASLNGLTNVEPYSVRLRKVPMTVGQRVIAVKPPVGYEGAYAKQYIVSVAGTTADVDTEPNWNTTDGGTTTDGTVTFRTMPKYPTIINYTSSTVLPVGTIVKPSTNSMKEYLVTSVNTAAASTPTWTSYDTLGVLVPFQTNGQMLCIAGCTTYAFNKAYAVGDVVKPSSTSTQEYLCTLAGISNSSALTLASVGLEALFGTAKFKRIV